MTQLTHDPAFAVIEDQLDAIGQKYRVQRIVRGALLFASGVIVASLLAALTAGVVGQSSWTWMIAAVWAGWIVASGVFWIVLPLLIRPKMLEVARLVESRVGNLHNGLTNSVLLASAADLQTSPWLPQIFSEILSNARGKSLDEAVKLSDLRALVLRLSYFVVPALLLMGLFHGRMSHGWHQMFSPTSFVPKIGAARIIDVQPDEVTLVAGQPLEITIIAKDPKMGNCKLIFDNKLPPAELVGSPINDAGNEMDGIARLRYAYRVEHVLESTRFRVEVGSTQSDWHKVNVVREVKLMQLSLSITPPSYTGQAASKVVLTPDQIDKTPIQVPQGSKIELSASVDVPVKAAMLQIGESTPAPMEVLQAGLTFSGNLVVMDEMAVAVLLTEGAGQIIARVPEQNFVIHCTRDAAPMIEMKWPTQDTAIAPSAEVKIVANLKDDYGVAKARVLVWNASDAAASSQAAPGSQPTPVLVVPADLSPAKPVAELAAVLDLKPELRKHGSAIRIQVEVSDNRALPASSNSSANEKDLGPQTTMSNIYEIKFRDPEQIKKDEKEKADKLRARLLEMLKIQRDLNEQTTAFKLLEHAAGGDQAFADFFKKIGSGQADLRTMMQQTAETFQFDEQTKVIQKTLLVLAMNPAKEAVDLSAAIIGEPLAAERVKLNKDLRARQRRIITTLESLLAMLNAAADPATQPTTRSGDDLANQREKLNKLNEDLKKFMKEEQRIMEQTANLAKKPVDNYDEADKKLLEELKAAQEKLDAFMQEKVSDFSKMAEQDMSNAALLKELMEVYSETTMAKDALKQKAAEIAVAAEDMGLELAKELSSNIEKWLSNTPDRQKWTQEDPLGKTDTPMAELPKELEDMVGELMEQQEDLFEDMEDMNANWTDSADKGIGWDAADGPIADMSAKGVTGNQLPNNNEMGGRAGEGRSGKSQGEMVEETASGKGGRNTPTRLDPTPFQKGQVKDTSKDPTGGATGGGKISGEGGEGLEGPVGPKQKQEMQRLAQKQAQLRNNAERLNLQYQVGKYDNFKMLESIALMRRVESDLKANRYQNALHRKDVLLDDMDSSRMMLSGRIHTQRDTTPQTSRKMKEDINDAMKGQLPAAWSDALKEYYKKLSQE